MKGWKGGTFHPPSNPQHIQNQLFMGGSATYKEKLAETGTGQGWNFHPSTPHHPRRLHPGTCPTCQHVILTGTYIGLHITLEPHPLTDLSEYHALRDGIQTWDLWPDMQARPRTLPHIKHRTIVPRHATHTCGTTYGTPPPAPPTNHQQPTADPPF